MAEQVFGFTNFMARLDGVGGPSIEDRKGIRPELRVHRFCRVRHVRSDDRGEEVNEVDGETNHGGTFGGLRLGKLVIKAVGLEKDIALLRNLQNRG